MSAPGTSIPNSNLNPPKPKKPPSPTSAPVSASARDREIALLEQISTSLDTYIDDNPRPVTLPPPVPSQAGSTTPTASDASKHAAKVRGRGPAECCQLPHFNFGADQSSGVVDPL